MRNQYRRAGLVALLTVFTPLSVLAAEVYPTQALFGDTHVHTKLSGDARGYGLTLSPEDAYRIAQGETLISTGGHQVKLKQPLDFMVVADHAEGYGLMDELIKGNPELLVNDTVKRWQKMLTSGNKQSVFLAVREIIQAQGLGKLPEKLTYNPKVTKGLWESNLQLAEKYNQPGKFTTLMGYEWSAMLRGNNLHRVVVFRDGIDKVKQTLPVDSNRSGYDPINLWRALEAYETNTGGRVLAIPHNPNLSGGMMFDYNRPNGIPINSQYAKLSQRWEPVIEMTQTKGDSEAHPVLSPTDEFADYETWDVANLALTQKTTPQMLSGSYVRSGLKRGLEMERDLSVNPYQYGMIGSSDTHTGITVTDEDIFFGKNTLEEPSPKRWKKPASMSPDGLLKNEGWTISASGIAGVWATENTREAIFDAIKRREVFATTGSRIKVRMFAGWQFDNELFQQGNWVEQAYQKGVPMGGVLASPVNTSGGDLPTIIVSALKDPLGANLDRVQIVKGWIDGQGNTQEKVIDVAWQDDRKLDADGKLPSIGTTVNVSEATYSNTIGSVEIKAVWQDSEYKPGQKAFYYARVLEIPTPRWTAYDAKKYQIKLPEDVPMVVVDRAYSSPIWIQ
ncbi:DUF3604 domain-containing protein [Maricurvus nonylphenolicus]|uniref:DUF3604 domain-containing protein n=1 Tax=Maricurvus nonylphenolicus TaxID=1008307 RepID=UPI0036F3C2B2